jgi:hypothetical protein
LLFIINIYTIIIGDNMKKKNSLFILIVLVLAISVGFALLSTTLNINGLAHINSHIWDIHWENVDNEDGVVPTEPATIDPNDNQSVTFSANFEKPGDYYEFTVDAVNRGDLDGMLKEITTTMSGTTVPDISKYLKLTIKYMDGTDYEANDLLPAGNKITYKVRLEYKDDISDSDLNLIPENGEPFIGTVTPIYIQSDNSAVDKHNYEPIPVETPVNLGDYIYMQGDIAKTNADTSYAGFSGSTSTFDQTLWRVIDIHSDGTFDAVSEYASTDSIRVGEVSGNLCAGYKNFIEGMQDIASHYSKEGYTVATRMMGYDGQTAIISDTTACDGSSSEPPSIYATIDPISGTGEEFQGGILGDTLYLKDYQLVKNVYGTVATTTKSGTAVSYWIASRTYYFYNNSYYWFRGRVVNTDGTLVSGNLVGREYGSWGWGISDSYHVRPIITLASGLEVNSGSGTKADPIVFK